jgi:cobalt transporter subunit CbtA
MIGRVLLAALLAGIVAGLLMGVIQHWRLTPLIVAAEKFEHADHDHSAATAESGAAIDEWAPDDGFERTLYTTLTAMVAGAAFAAILAGIALLIGATITPTNGLLWGLAGFFAASLAPAAGLPPELPGMPVGDLLARQIWWAGTIIATGLGIWLLVFRDELAAKFGAIVLLAIPHVIGAPSPAGHESAVPASLAASFTANSLAAAAAFWCMIGAFLGLAMNRFAKDI